VLATSPPLVLEAPVLRLAQVKLSSGKQQNRNSAHAIINNHCRLSVTAQHMTSGLAQPHWESQSLNLASPLTTN
jgi:hypothetical protein